MASLVKGQSTNEINSNSIDINDDSFSVEVTPPPADLDEMEPARTTDSEAQKATYSERASRRQSRPSKRQSYGGRGSMTEDGEMKAVFVDAAAMKEKVRQTLCKPTHKVSDYYKTKGVWQAIARNMWFENVTLGVISFNALWISVDTDHNDAELLLNAHPIFMAAENFFCAYFFIEWFVRFMAFKRKRDGLRDKWFTFDSGMVLMMVLETWVMTIVTAASGSGGSGGMGNASILRVARLLRLSRMARMARLLRAMPELMILIKGMVAACRSVFFTLFLLMIIMYVFAIGFTQLTTDLPIGETHFKSVPESMYTLLLYGTLLDDVGMLSRKMGHDGLYLNVIFFLYVLLAALTVMNMLIGVLCEVVSAVAATEREEMLVGYVHRKVHKIVEELDKDGGGSISKDEFVQILENIEAVKALQDVGVDVVGLVDFADVIFEGDEELSFTKFMEVVLQLRGSNTATVKDIVDLRKLVHTESVRTHLTLSRMESRLSQGLLERTSEYAGSRKNSIHSLYSKHSCVSNKKSAAEQPFAEDGDPGELYSPVDSETSERKPLVARDVPPDIKIDECLLADASMPAARPSSRVHLMVESSGQSTPCSDVFDPGMESGINAIPLESEANALQGTSCASTWSAASPGNLNMEILLRSFRGPWSPCTLNYSPLEGNLQKVLEMPAYWTAVRHNELLRIDPFIQHQARIMTDLSISSGVEKLLKAQQAADPGLASNHGGGSEACWLPFSPQYLRGQIADIGTVMKIGLCEIQRIQRELSLAKQQTQPGMKRTE